MGSDVISEPLTAAERNRSLASSFPLLSQKSDIRDIEEVKAAAKVPRDERAALSARKEASVWETPPGLDAM